MNRTFLFQEILHNNFCSVIFLIKIVIQENKLQKSLELRNFDPNLALERLNLRDKIFTRTYFFNKEQNKGFLIRYEKLN